MFVPQQRQPQQPQFQTYAYEECLSIQQFQLKTNRSSNKFWDIVIAYQ